MLSLGPLCGDRRGLGGYGRGLALACLAWLVALAGGQDGAGGSAGKPINIFVITDKGDMVSSKSIEVACDYLEKNSPMGFKIGKKMIVEATGADAYEAVEKICADIDSMIDGGTPPDIVLDTTRAGMASEVVKSLTLTLGIPTVTATYGEKGDIRDWRDLTPEQQKYLIQVRPPGDLLPDILRDLILMQNITNAGILYDDSFVMDKKYKSLLLNVPCRHIINKIKMSDTELKKQLMRLDEVDINNYFILGSSKTIKRVFDMGNSMKLYGEKYAWFAGTKDSNAEFDASCCNDMKVAFFSPSSSSSSNMRNYKDNYGLTVLPEIDAAFYFSLAVRSLKAVKKMKDEGTWPDINQVKCSEYGESTPIARDIDLISAFKAVQGEDLYGPMMIKENGMSYMQFNLNIITYQIMSKKIAGRKEVGSYAVGTPGSMNFRSGMESALAGFAATTVYRVVTVVQPPFIMKNDDGTGYEGYCVDLINELKQLMDFEYEIYEAPENAYGRMNADGEWNGMVRELLDKKADIALGAFSVMAERENVVDFTVPYYDLVGISILMKKPSVPTSLFKFLSVLEDSVWCCILAAYFVTSFLLWVFDHWSPYSYQNNIEGYADDEEKRYFDLKECLWFCMTSLTPQGGGEAPKNLSGRLVAATWWLFGFIIIASYTANLAAFLTVSRLETPVESLEDLSKQYKIQYSPMNNSATATYFERMAYIEEKFYEVWKDLSLDDSLSEVERSKLAVWDYPVSDKYTKIWQSMKEAGLPQTFEDALARVRTSKSSSEGYAFLGDATDIKYQTLTNCDLQMVGDEFSRKPYAVAVQQGSPLKDQFNDAILKLLNQRKLETLKERWWNQNPKKKVCDNSDDDTGGISIYNIGGVFIVIFVGIGLAIITLIGEYWYYKYKKPNDSISPEVPRQLTVAEFEKQLQGKNGNYGHEKTDFDTEYTTNGSNIAPSVAPVGNPW